MQLSHHSIIPSGWYFCAESKEIKRGRLIEKKLFGKKIILWRTLQGKLNMSDAVCPHLGSDLGKLGSVVGEHLKCFSHDYTYNELGDCVATGFKTLPNCHKGVLQCYPVQEVNGFVLAWFDAQNAAPNWFIPHDVICKESAKYVRSNFVFNVSLETINEDNFDVGHLYKWHNVFDIKTTPVEKAGPIISISHAFKRHSILFKKKLKPPFSRLTKEVRSRYSSTLYGHGLTDSYIDIFNLNIRLQDLIWCTPISATKTMYTTFVRLVKRDNRKKWQSVLDNVLQPIIFRACIWRLRQEHLTEGHGFWERQTKLATPILTEKEIALIGPYREWCKQFTKGE